MDTARQIAGALAPYAVEIVVTFVIPFVGVAVTKWLKAKTSAERQALIAQAAAVAYWVAEQVERKAPDGTPVNTLAEMAMIPEEAVPRFLAELPEMLAVLRLHNVLNAQAREAAGQDLLTLRNMTWTDDGKRGGAVTLSVLSDG